MVMARTIHRMVSVSKTMSLRGVAVCHAEGLRRPRLLSAADAGGTTRGGPW